MTLSQHSDLTMILILIYCFVDDFINRVLGTIRYAIERPGQQRPPLKKHNLSTAELVTLALFRFFTGHRNWKEFYQHIRSYHAADFPSLPQYKNFLGAINRLALFASLLLEGFMSVFRRLTPVLAAKFADSTKLKVCEIKREFSHRTCKNVASKSKSSMGWFYGFKLHIICNELMQILKIRLTTATVDDRKALVRMWNNIFGMIIADAGYVGKRLQQEATKLGKHLFTGVRTNMRKVMTTFEHHLLKLRQYVETVFSILCSTWDWKPRCRVHCSGTLRTISGA